MQVTTTCDKFVYISGNFAYRTDQDGVDYLKQCVRDLDGDLREVEVRDHYHSDRFIPLGATGAWIRMAADRYGPVITAD